MATLSPSAEQIADSTGFRAALRRDKLAARMALDKNTHTALSTRIEAHLAALLTPLPPAALAFCSPVRAEVDLRPLLCLLIQRGWQAAMPVVEAVDAPMSFRTWTPASAMGVDRYGIPFPLDGSAIFPAVLLLPLIAFDARGFRLGYGGGYFDRTLATLVPQPLAIGVGFELGRVDDIRPHAHDIPVDAVVTESGIVRHARPGQSRSSWPRGSTSDLASLAISDDHDKKEGSI